MTRDQIYEIWRPAGSPWSRWVKPVLFAFLRDEDLETTYDAVPEWRIPHTATAMIADLPDADGVVLGVALSRNGYQPIPVYNASPFALYDPGSTVVLSITKIQPLAVPSVVDVLPIMSALCGTAKTLAAANLPSSAPPVFLLDLNRPGQPTPDVDRFDNRSFVTPTDFPSPEFFKHRRISQIVVVQTTPKIQPDLLMVLLAFQQDGMKILQQAPWEPWKPRPITVKRPPIIVHAWEWLRRIGYQRNPSQAFGGLVRPSSS
jgi:hypothetical protein